MCLAELGPRFRWYTIDIATSVIITVVVTVYNILPNYAISNRNFKKSNVLIKLEQEEVALWCIRHEQENGTSNGAVSTLNVRHHEIRGSTTSICEMRLTTQNMNQIRGNKVFYMGWSQQETEFHSNVFVDFKIRKYTKGIDSPICLICMGIWSSVVPHLPSSVHKH
jgi:hypothetical protein